MPNIITTARGEKVDLDVIRIKGQLAQAPMTVEVEKRKLFIDVQEGAKPQQVIKPTPEAIAALEEIKSASNIQPEDDPALLEVEKLSTKKK